MSLAKFFGVDPKKEKHLFWILKLADDLPLPPSWIQKIGKKIVKNNP